jgi:hypothetical protein
MYTSFALVALAVSVAASSPQEGLAWQKDYTHAMHACKTEKKPMAVFFGSGKAGYGKVCKDGQLSTALQKLLADNYVCMYVDVSTPAGEKLAADFAITQGQGLVLSSRTGDVQAFYHDGDLNDGDLTRWVNRFADPNVIVRTTMTNSSTRVSLYPPDAGGASGYGYGAYTQGGYGYAPQHHQRGQVWYGGGGGCPGGRCR